MLVRFWERPAQYACLRRFLTDPNPGRILLLYGPKGSGKTTLILRTIEDLKKEYGDLWKYEVEYFDFHHKTGSMEDLISEIRNRLIPDEKPKFFDLDELIIYMFSESERNRKNVLDLILENVENREKPLILVFDGLKPDFDRPYYRDYYYSWDDDYDRFDLFEHADDDYTEVILSIFLAKLSEKAHIIFAGSNGFAVRILEFWSKPEKIQMVELGYFSDKEARDILVSEGLSKEDATYFVKNVGGIPAAMNEVLRRGNVKDYVEELYIKTKAKAIRFVMRKLEDFSHYNRTQPFKTLITIAFRRHRFEVMDRNEYVTEFLKNELIQFDFQKNRFRFQRKYEERVFRELFKELREFSKNRKKTSIGEIFEEGDEKS